MLELAVHLPIGGGEDVDHQKESAQDLATEGVGSLHKTLK